ncbi:hypothetical protein Bca4012_010714 [Brassica carinata]
MSGARLEFESHVEDAISKLKFSPESNNLLIASWDSVRLSLLAWMRRSDAGIHDEDKVLFFLLMLVLQ